MSLDELADEVVDEIYPQLRLCADLSDPVKAGQANAGEWHADVLPRGAKSVVVRVVSGKQTRSLGEWVDGEYIADCESANGKVGVGTPGGACKDCPMAAWTDAKDRRGRDIRVKPECSEILTFLVDEQWSGERMELRMERSKLPAAKRLVRMGAGGRLLELSSEQKNAGGHDYWLPIVRYAPDAPAAVVNATVRAMDDGADDLPW